MSNTDMTLRTYGMQLCFATFAPGKWVPSQMGAYGVYHSGQPSPYSRRGRPFLSVHNCILMKYGAMYGTWTSTCGGYLHIGVVPG